MEECHYHQVNKEDIKTESEKKDINAWKPFVRQVIVCSGIWTSFFTQGLLFGAPTVMIPQLRKEANSTEAVTEEMASWISSTHVFAGLPGVILLPLLSARFGRKYIVLSASIIILIGFILFYCSTTITHILIAEIILGILNSTQITINIISITEYTSPRYRGLFLTLKSASVYWGLWVSNALGTFFHWRNILALGIACTLYDCVLTLFWCESPYWLASKYRFEECAKYHRWIKGEDKESEKELQKLIKSYEKSLETDKTNYINNPPNFLAKWWKIAINKSFYKPILLCFALLSSFVLTGKLIVSIYAIDIIKKITVTESSAYVGMLILDGVTVAGMYVGCGLSKVLKRRTLLLGGFSFGVLFLFCLSLYLYLISLSIIEENKYVSLALLVFFTLPVSGGPMILCTSIYGELVPIRFRTSSMLILGVFNELIMFTSLKTGLIVFRYFKLHGAFLLFGILTTIETLFLYKFLPETKDKTLQEIENGFIGDPKRKDAKLTLINE